MELLCAHIGAHWLVEDGRAEEGRDRAAKEFKNVVVLLPVRQRFQQLHSKVCERYRFRVQQRCEFIQPRRIDRSSDGVRSTNAIPTSLISSNSKTSPKPPSAQRVGPVTMHSQLDCCTDVCLHRSRSADWLRL